MEIDKLIEISREINAESITRELEQLKVKMSKTDCDLILPFVGEFSSGKTTLINALTDSKQLETNFDPTTATIFEVHFGCDSCCAEVFDKEGKSTHYDNIADLKNDKLGNNPFVLVHDTSKRVPSTTVIVDTPGLSSPDIRHKQALVNFLPQADGIILVIDVNQPITRSLTEFIKTMKLSDRPVFLVITKCDTKTQKEVEAQKKYISENCEIDIKQTACVSAKNNDVQQLYDLFQSIMAEKNNILKKVNEQRMNLASEKLKSCIDEMLKVSSSDDELEESIKKHKAELNNFNRSINRLISDSTGDIEEIGRNVSSHFQDTIVSRLNSIATAKGINYDAEAISAINNTATLLQNEFKNNVRQAIKTKATSLSGNDSVNIQSLNNISLPDFDMSGIGYGMNLNEAGHEYDNAIKIGVIGIAAVAAVAAAPAVLGASGTAAAGAAGSGAASGISTSTLLIEGTELTLAGRALSKASQVQQKAESIEKKNGGVLGNLIGKITDATMGKPQRIRAINNYVDSTLMPAFKAEIDRIGNEIVNGISTVLYAEAETTITEKNQILQKLAEQRKANQDEFERRMTQLRDYRNML
ncbi:MAG: dynamin family protein [Bacteroidales bacterium]|nr:dynamin family protein [Bacteroidales bacterium]